MQNFRPCTSLFRNNPHEHAVGYRAEEFLEALLPGEINIKYESTEIWDKKNKTNTINRRKIFGRKIVFR